MFSSRVSQCAQCVCICLCIPVGSCIIEGFLFNFFLCNSFSVRGRASYRIDHDVISLLLRFRGHCGRGERENIRTRGGWMTLRKHWLMGMAWKLCIWTHSCWDNNVHNLKKPRPAHIPTRRRELDTIPSLVTGSGKSWGPNIIKTCYMKLLNNFKINSNVFLSSH